MKKSLTLFVYWFILVSVMLSGADAYSASKYESEPNENRSSATAVSFGDKMFGSMWHALDYDWYAVNVPSAGLVSLTAYYEFPDGATTDTATLYIELRDSSNKALSDFFIDYKSMGTPYIRDVNIPSSGTYYVVVHCPSTAKFKRDRYYISIANGGGENSKVKFQNEEGSVVLKVDEDNDEESPPIATLKASVSDEDGNPVQGALVAFSLIDPDSRELIFSNDDATAGITESFHLFEGDKQITVKYTDLDYILTFDGPSYFSATLINVADEEDELFLYSITTDDTVSAQVTKTIISEGDYYLKVRPINSSEGLWEVTIPNTSDTVNQIGTATTGADGIATYTYKSTARKGEFTITASFGNSSDQFKIEQLAGSASKISIVELDNETLYINREYEIKVKVTDSNNNTVEDGTEVNLASTGLTIKSATVKTESGMAKFTISSLTAKTYTLTASAIGDSFIKDTLTVKFNAVTLSNIMAQPAYILADGKSTSIISVRLNDSSGLAVGGEPITFSTTCGTLLTNTANTATETDTANGTIAGVANIALTAPFTPGTCTVTAAYGTKKLTTPVEFYGDGTGSTTTSILLETESKTVPANGTSSVVLKATLSDNAGSPVAAGTPVKFTTDKGLFPNGTQSFNGSMPAGGVVKVALLSKNGETGKANITCSSGGISQSIQITFTKVNTDGSPAGESTAFIKLTASPTTILADGKSSLMVSAELFDSTNKAVPQGTEVIFYAANGKFANGLTETVDGKQVNRFTAATTDESGKVYVALISSTTAGSVDVWCYSNGVFQLTQVTFKGGSATPDVGSIALTAEPTTIPANGFSSTSITADIKDTTGNPVPSGTSITFSTNAGKFSNGTTTITTKTSDTLGKITIPLISAATAGYAQVTATSGGATQSTLVTFEGVEQQRKTAYIDLSASPEKIPADGKSSLTVTATLYDSTGKVMPRGTEATFTATSGVFLNGSTQYTLSTADDSGKLSISLISSLQSGSSDITCRSNNVTQLKTVYFTGSDTGIGSTTSIELSRSPDTITADGASSSTITATLKDSTNSPVSQGTSVTFTTTLGTLSRTTVTTVDNTGVVYVSLKSGTEAGTARVVCTSNGITQATTVIFTGGTSDTKTPAHLALALSQISVKTDNSDSSTVTATVLDANFAVIPGIQVSFTSDGGQLNTSLVETDNNGQAQVVFSSGTIDKSNRVVTVTADVPILDPKTIPVQVTGSTISLLNNGTDLILDDATTPANESNSSVLTITANDAGGKPVYDTPITITSITGGQTGSISWTPATPYRTDINGQVKITVKGAIAGSAGINIQGLGTTATQSYTVAVLADSFGITLPAADLTKISTADAAGLTVTVRAPTQTQVKFATTMGGLDGGDLQVKMVNVVGGYASVVVRSDLAGLATVEVSDNSNPATVDRVSVAFYRPSGDAATIKLQSNTAVISPTVGANKSIAEFTAFVKTSGDTGNQAVAGVPVVFSIDNSTGSGENVSPVIVYTNESGEAKTTFTSGSLGSDADGVTVNARVVGSGTTGNLSNISFTPTNTITRGSGSFVDDGFKNNQQIKVNGSSLNDGYYTVKNVTTLTLTLDSDDHVNTEAAGRSIIITALTHSTNIVIGGTSGSVVIGRGAGDSIVILNPTTYSLFMSVLVADLNGNPVPGAIVSLSLWPQFYSTGVWFDLNDRTSDHYVPYMTGSFYNEDLNENTFLDPGEDTNKDGILTPPNSAAGNIPITLTTNSDGLAEFSIIYLKSSAVWISARIIATTMVFGTETKASMSFTLPAEKTEAEAGYLPDSAYPYVLTCTSGGTASFRLPAFAGGDHDTFIPLRGSAVGVGAGVDSNGDGTPDYYDSYNYSYTDVGSPAGTVYYDFISVSDAACATTFPVKIIIE